MLLGQQGAQITSGAVADPAGGGEILLERDDANVWTVDRDGTNLTQVSDVPEGWRATGTVGLDSGKSSAFSPDGRRVAYLAFREDRTVVELWIEFRRIPWKLYTLTWTATDGS